MSEEEQKAIWYCSEMLADNENDIEHWKIVEDYIDKLQKENEELKEGYQKQWEENCRLALYIDKVRIENRKILENTAKNYISKGKIRNKIKELEKRNNHSVVKMELLEVVLKELLEEEK